MKVKLYHDQRSHRLRSSSEDDPRLAYTVCGVLFAWGHVPRRQSPADRCEECWS